ncbi:aspartyl/asparaginyl beta-hydroxylase domain-containing protein [Photobacterium minamisatsumaniensis]|uniref:aspartyl/asparaginyl beta-hydroxylase domain-containing protein n=1 Tax=Photobacterium minamisatsumaniensis TaxID=2910233 RepID=UPI003D0E0354
MMNFLQLTAQEVQLLSNSQWCSTAKIDDRQWLMHVNKVCFEGEWSVIPLRGLRKYKMHSPILQAFSLEASSDPEQFENYLALEHFADINRFFHRFPCSILSARLMKLTPGAVIKPHRDKGLSPKNGQVRLHYCLQGDPKVEFVVGGESLVIREGELWFINADIEHSVYHRGSQPRIHLVFDCVVNHWLKKQLGMEF